jgi:SAM-dependent methyltransferase
LDSTHTSLPPGFLQRLTELESAYIRASDPLKQSGFSGGAERWQQERSPILDAICDHATASHFRSPPCTTAEILDIGCANGYLLECLLQWGAARGIHLIPFGIDCGEALVTLARQRLPGFANNFFVGNAWGWVPPRTFRYVYCVFDCVPPTHLGAFVGSLLSKVVAPGGRLIMGSYGNRSRGETPASIDRVLAQHGYPPVGTASGGSPEMARFAWVDT